MNVFERFEDRCISTPVLNGLSDVFIILSQKLSVREFWYRQLILTSKYQENFE